MIHNRKRLIALLAALVLVIGCAVGATVAWLIVSTPSVTNTFTTGDINITLSEHKLNADGTRTNDWIETNAQTIKLMPGMSIQKDPTVTVVSGSAPCYVRMFMILEWSDLADDISWGDAVQTWFAWTPDWVTTQDSNMLKLEDNISNVHACNIYEFRWPASVDAENGNVTLDPLFNAINVPGIFDATNPTDQTWIKALDDYKISFVAQAVQSQGFDDVNDAFNDAAVPLPDTVQTYVDMFNQLMSDAPTGH